MQTKNINKGKIRKGFLTVMATLSIIGGAGILNAYARKSHDNSVARNLNTFNTIVRNLEEYYVDSIPVERTFEAALDALLSEIDPYTEYYTTAEKESFQTMTKGEYGGIGSYISEKDSATYISGPHEGSPAALAGLKSGDRIVLVDGVDTRRMGSDKVTKLLKGKPGTRVNIEVIRPYTQDSVKQFTIQRAKLNIPSVTYSGILKDGIGYIRLTSFMERSAEEVRKALDQLQSGGELKGLVLDLRGNGGGLLEQAVEIVNYFVPKGTEILRTKGKEKDSERIYKTTRKPLLEDIPLAILIDGASASASEITAGAIQDLDRGILIGTRSFGKGLVQTTLPLPYDQMMKVTTAKYYLPSGRLIQARDYSRRNPDGSVAFTPDSLANTFKTLHGREVRDGGGLQPDIKVNWEAASALVYNLVRDRWIFDYATKYAAEHPTIPPASEFEITDEIYADFKQFIDPSKLKYDKVCEQMLKSLRKTAEDEGYMTDSTAATFDALAEMLTHNLDKDLDTHRESIASYLGAEIVNRYYYTTGETEYELKDDPAIARALEYLSDPAKMRTILKK